MNWIWCIFVKTKIVYIFISTMYNVDVLSILINFINIVINVCSMYNMLWAGADPGFQVRGGELKKNCAEWREVRKILGYFVWKITILRQKNHIFSNFRGGVHPPGSTPDEDHIGGVMLIGQLASLESGGSWVQTPVMPNGKKNKLIFAASPLSMQNYSESKDWYVVLKSVYGWSDMSTHTLLFQWAITMKIQLRVSDFKAR